MFKKRLLFFAMLVCIFSLTACSTGDTEKAETINNPYTRTEYPLGTVATLKIYTKDKRDALDPAFERIAELERKLTVNEGDYISEVEKINQNAGIAPVNVSDDTFQFIKDALGYTQQFDGILNVTIGPLTKLWDIGFEDARKPEQSEIDAVLPLLDYNDVTLDEENKTVFLHKEGMRFDFGAIAKGYIADEVAKVLVENGVNSAIIDLGGNIYVVGESYRGGAWTIGIQDPFSTRGEIVGTVPATDQSIVTSGVYERYFEYEGKVYHHILNSETGYPYDNNVAGVTIVSDKSIDGDAYTTLAFGLGIEEGLAAIEAIDGLEAIYISYDKDIYITSGLKGIFELKNDEFTLHE